MVYTPAASDKKLLSVVVGFNEVQDGLSRFRGFPRFLSRGHCVFSIARGSGIPIILAGGLQILASGP